MKILLTDLGDGVNAKGGIEKVVCSMANAFVERGHEVGVMIFDRRQGTMFFPLDERVQFFNPGAGVHINRTWVNLTNLFFLDKDKKEYRRHRCVCKHIAKIIAPILNNWHPDIIIAHEFKSMMVLKDILQISIPVVRFFHFDPATIFHNRYFSATIEKADCINVLLPSFGEATKKFIVPRKVVCIPNVVPQYDGVCDYGSKVIINVARIEHKQKRQRILIDAFAKLAKDFPEWKVELWGDVDFDKAYYQELLQVVRQYGLEDRVLFCGSTKNVPEKLSRASIFAFPSAYEGFGLALTEAMSMGLPVIGCKNCPAVNEIIQNGQNGLLTEDGADAFAEGLGRLMADESLRRQYGLQAKEAMRDYSAEVVWGKWEKLLQHYKSSGEIENRVC